MKRYTGERTIDGISVLVDGEPLSPRTDQLKLTDYGFEWSYEGPEPSQLAFAILFDHLGNAAEAKSLYPELHAADRRQFRQRVGNDERRHRRRDRRAARRSCRLARFPKAFP